MNEIKVLVVGAGPTGLMMAAELARYGISVRIIDKSKEPSTLSKALAIQPRTLEIFKMLGISDKFLEKGQKLLAANPISHFKQLAHIDFSFCESPFPYILSVPQCETEKLLEQHLNELGVSVEREVELTDLKEEDQHVRCQLTHHASNKQEEITVSWVIGCDGAHSFVRKHLDLSFIGKTFSDIYSLADVRLSWKYAHDEIFAFPDALGTVAAFPLPEKNRYRLIFQLQRCRNLMNQIKGGAAGIIKDERIADPTSEEALALIRQVADPDAEITESFWMANFHINSRLASTYQKGRIFLAGDAAHIHSPVGGQGMNTGLQDAFNLGWKLSLAAKGVIPKERIDTYQLERHTLAKKLLRATENATYLTTLKNPVALFLRDFIISQAMKVPSVQKMLVSQITQVAICYPKTRYTYSNGSFYDGPKLGSRAPDLSFGATDLLTVMKNPKTFFLLVFSGLNPNEKIMERIQSYDDAPKNVGPVTVIKIVHKQNPIDGAFPDSSGFAHHIYGLKSAGAYLVRPDGYIESRWQIK